MLVQIISAQVRGAHHQEECEEVLQEKFNNAGVSNVKKENKVWKLLLP